MNNPRDAWLAWQAEIGTGEVVLAAPWKRPRTQQPPATVQLHDTPDTADTAVPKQSHEEPAPARAEMEQQPTGTGFFRSIAEKLAEHAEGPPSRPRASATVPPPPVSPPLPEFTNVEAYWKWLAENWPLWFPGAPGSIVRAEGHASPRLALVELFPAADRPFTGEAGELLDKMMQAIGLTREDLYLTTLMKTAPPGRAWTRKDTARVLPVLLHELRLARCEMVLLLGESCAQAVLRTGRGMPALAGPAAESESIEGVTFAAIWHPADLLRDASLKKPAWARLQWVQARLPKRGS